MDKIKLKPCPFCGKQAIVNTIEPHTHIFVSMPDYGGGTFIECTGCTCAISGKTETEAVDAWNNRVLERTEASQGAKGEDDENN